MRTIGVLLIAHAPLASAFASAAGDIGLPVSGLTALDITPDMSREQAFSVAKMLLADMRCLSCLVLVDLGGCCSPCTVAHQLRDTLGTEVRIVTGLNVAMLATALCHAHLEIDELARHVVRRGSDSAAVLL